MDAVKFLKEKNRMTRYEDGDGICNIECGACGLSSDNNSHKLGCMLYMIEYPEEAVAIVEKWSKEHPQKTYKDDFLEKFPNAQIDEFKVPRVHWCEVYNDGVCRYKSTGGMHLCCDCWNEPMED